MLKLRFHLSMLSVLAIEFAITAAFAVLSDFPAPIRLFAPTMAANQAGAV